MIYIEFNDIIQSVRINFEEGLNMKSTKKTAQSLIEYGLILALVAVIAVTVLSRFGQTMTNVGNTTNDNVNNATTNATQSYCTSIGCSGVANGLCTGCPNN